MKAAKYGGKLGRTGKGEAGVRRATIRRDEVRFAPHSTNILLQLFRSMAFSLGFSRYLANYRLLPFYCSKPLFNIAFTKKLLGHRVRSAHHKYPFQEVVKTRTSLPSRGAHSARSENRQCNVAALSALSAAPSSASARNSIGNFVSPSMSGNTSASTVTDTTLHSRSKSCIATATSWARSVA